MGDLLVTLGLGGTLTELRLVMSMSINVARTAKLLRSPREQSVVGVVA